MKSTIAKAVWAGAGSALTGYTALQVTGHLGWLQLTGVLVAGALTGLSTWAVPYYAPTAAPAATPPQQ